MYGIKWFVKAGIILTFFYDFEYMICYASSTFRHNEINMEEMLQVAIIIIIILFYLFFWRGEGGQGEGIIMA